MADASKALLRGYDVKLMQQLKHCSSVWAFRSTARAGLRHRPALLRAEAVALELRLQSMMHPHLTGAEASQWKRRPNLRLFTPALYTLVFLDERQWLRNPTRLNVNTMFTPVVD